VNPSRVDRERTVSFTDLPNVGKAIARDFRLMGFAEPGELAGLDPRELYLRLCEVTGKRQDPCVLDLFMSVVSFLNGEEPKPWWHFTAARKELLKKRQLQGENDEKGP